MKLHNIEIPVERIAAFCHENGIRRLALFGSILRDDFGSHSDIDVLVEFHPGVRVGLSFFGIQDDLSEIFGRRVDLNTANFISEIFRKQVVEEAEVVYVAA